MWHAPVVQNCEDDASEYNLFFDRNKEQQLKQFEVFDAASLFVEKIVHWKHPAIGHGLQHEG